MDNRKLQTFWQPGGDKPHGRIQTLNFGTERIADMRDHPDHLKAREYAEEIVRRYNAFPALVEALEEALSDLQPPDTGGLTGAEHDAGAAEGTIIKIREALKAAKG